MSELAAPLAPDRWLVVGLGNPGPDYAGNRHNVGAMVVDTLAARSRTSFKSGVGRARALVAETRLGVLPPGAPGPRVVLAKPQSYMNESGAPVSGLTAFFGIDPNAVVVVHDELDIPFGEVRLKLGGGEGGHNGLRSVTRSLGTKEYHRVRVGIGRPPGRMDPADYVLRDFSGPERKELGLLLEEAADAVELLVTDGLERAQARFHAPG